MIKRLYLLVEGNDDERFFKHLIKPIMDKVYDTVKIWQYAQRPKNTRVNFLESIKSMGADYIYIADMDEIKSVNKRKRKIIHSLEQLNKDKIVIVIKEIESWYLAGIDEKNSVRLGIENITDTSKIFKEDFNKLIPAKFDSRIDFMHEIIKSFSINTGKRKNSSFNYFCNNFIEPFLYNEASEQSAATLD